MEHHHGEYLRPLTANYHTEAWIDTLAICSRALGVSLAVATGYGNTVVSLSKPKPKTKKSVMSLTLTHSSIHDPELVLITAFLLAMGCTLSNPEHPDIKLTTKNLKTEPLITKAAIAAAALEAGDD